LPVFPRPAKMFFGLQTRMQSLQMHIEYGSWLMHWPWSPATFLITIFGISG
jgi:hypothetical protein